MDLQQPLFSVETRLSINIEIDVQDWSNVNSSHTRIPFKRKYMIRDEEGVDILKQNIGNFTLKNGAEVHIASFGIFNLTLWDDVMAQFAPLTSNDVILVGEMT